MEVENCEYKLSQAFPCHKQGVRCIDAHSNLIISGSSDKTVKIFSLVGDKYEMISDVNFFDDYIYCVKVNLNGQGFFVGSKDTHIYVLDSTGSPTLTLQGHTGPVCSLCQLDDNTLVSGSWDGTARVWDIREGKEVLKLEGHSHAVSVLGVVQLDLIVTGSQDKCLNFWRLSTGELIRKIKDAHNDIIRQISFVEDVGFLSASNDEHLKLWTFDGEEVSVLSGHSAFVFSCAALTFGTYISGSEDNTVKLWNDTQLKQTILHPGTVWSVAVNTHNLDIISACADGSVRIFTNDSARVAPAQQIEDFNSSAQLANAKGPHGLHPDELAKLPDVSQLQSFAGKKDGELKIFKNAGVPEAYAWKAVEYKWDKIGEVLSANSKKNYEGDQFFAAGDYDYIFDVEDDSGVRKSIPFNETDNPLEAAEKYCARENIGRGNAEQIRQFLMKNTKNGQSSGYTTNNNSGKQNQQQQQQQYQQQQPQAQQQIQSQYFPINQFQLFEQRNMEGLRKKVLEFNDILKQQSNEFQLGEKQLFQLNLLVEMLDKPNLYYSSRVSSVELEVFTVKLLNWPREYMLPVFDLFRVFALHPQSDSLFAGVDSGLNSFTLICGALMNKESSDVLKNLVLKLLCNLFSQTSARYAIYKHYRFIVECIELLRNSQNQNVLSSLATFLFNVSAEYVNNQNHTSEAMTAYLNQILFIIPKEQNVDNLLKYLIATANFSLKSPQIAKPLARLALANYSPPNDVKLSACFSDLKKIL